MIRKANIGLLMFFGLLISFFLIAASIFIYQTFLASVSCNGWPACGLDGPFPISKEIATYWRKTDTDNIHEMLNSGERVDARNSVHGLTALHYAAQLSKDVEVAKLLLDEGADVNARDNYGSTPLHYANRNSEVAEILVERGADVRARNNGDSTPLHRAVYTDNEDVVRLLLKEEVDVNARDDDDETPLHNIKESTTIVGLLLREGADVNARDWFGNTPLHEAVRRNNPDVVFVLIHSGADVNARDDSGDTPLHEAVGVFYKSPEITKILIDNGADIHAVDDNGYTPLKVASFFGNIEAIELLLIDQNLDEDTVERMLRIYKGE